MPAKASFKEQVLNLLTSDSDVIQEIAESVSTAIVEKLLSSKDIIKNMIATIIDTDQFKEALDLGRQDIYESVTYDLTQSKEKYEALEAKNNQLTHQLATLEEEVDSLQQYSRRNCLLIHQVKEVPNESTDDAALGIFKQKLNIDLDPSDLDRSHRIGRKSSSRARPIIVKFTAYNIRNKVFRAKRNLKGQGITITESLTKLRLQLLKEAKLINGVVTTWTMDGRIFCLRSDDSVVVVERKQDLSKVGTLSKPQTRNNAS